MNIELDAPRLVYLRAMINFMQQAKVGSVSESRPPEWVSDVALRLTS